MLRIHDKDTIQLATCTEKIEKFVLGTTEYTVLKCELAAEHGGGHRTALENSTEGLVTILAWFKKKDK